MKRILIALLLLAPLGANRTEIQELLDKGGAVVLPPGEHEIDSTLYVKSRSIVTGPCVLKFTGYDEKVGAYLSNQHYGAKMKEVDVDIELRDITIEGTHNRFPSGDVPDNKLTHGIRFVKVSGLSLTNCVVRDVSGFGVFNIGCRDVTIHRNLIEFTGRDGCHHVSGVWDGWKDVPRFVSENIRITDNVIRHTSDDCCALHCESISGPNRANVHTPIRNVTIIGNTFGPMIDHPVTSGRALVLTGVADSLVLGNKLLDCDGSAILIQGTHRIIGRDEMHNVIHGPTRSENLHVVGNLLLNPASIGGRVKVPHAILLDRCDRSVVAPNVVRTVAKAVSVRVVDCKDTTYTPLLVEGGKTLRIVEVP